MSLETQQLVPNQYGTMDKRSERSFTLRRAIMLAITVVGMVMLNFVHTVQLSEGTKTDSAPKVTLEMDNEQHVTFKGTTEAVQGDAQDYTVEKFYDIQYATADRFMPPIEYQYDVRSVGPKVKNDNGDLEFSYGASGKWEEGRPIPDTDPVTGTKLIDMGVYKEEIKTTSGKRYAGVRCEQFNGGIEQCLYLDVLRPEGTSPEDKKAVMVYIHGGGMIVGSKNNYNFVDGLMAMVHEDVIVVAINYRLNVYGWWTNPLNSTQGLWGLRDQIQALRWVKRHIEDFGGNKNCVTIFGQSGGGLSVTALYASPVVSQEELIHRAIAQSPGWQNPAQYQQSSTKAAESMGQAAVDKVGCKKENTAEEMRKCMQRKSYKRFNFDWWYQPWKVYNLYSEPKSFLTGLTMAGYDGTLLTQPLYTAACNGSVANATGSDVPLLIGSNDHEWTFFDHEYLINRHDYLNRFLDFHLDEINKKTEIPDHDKVKSCLTTELKSDYANFTKKADYPFADRYDKLNIKYPVTHPDLSQLMTDVAFTVGPQLLSSAPGANKYRYRMTTTGLGEQYGGHDSSHGDELCFYHESSMKHWKGYDGGCAWKGVTSDWCDLEGKDGHRGCNGGQISNEAQKDKKHAGRILRQFWTNFAKDGVPSSALAAEIDVPEWTPVDPSNTLEGVPYMHLNFAGDGTDSNMLSSAWSTTDSAARLAKLACDEPSALESRGASEDDECADAMAAAAGTDDQ